MTRDEMVAQIRAILSRMLAEQGKEVPVITQETYLIGERDLPIDSLDLAILITELEAVTQKDPFKEGFPEFRTVGDLAALYEE
ncbi:MAG: acyl carrier protein [Bacillota bacterium]